MQQSAALAHGATGYLNTDWGDLGHLQQPVISEPGFAYGAAVSWCLESNAGPRPRALRSRPTSSATATGGLADAVLSLGDAHRLVTPQFPNMSTLVMNLYYPQLPVGRGLTKGLTAEELAAVERCLDEARAARPTDHTPMWATPHGCETRWCSASTSSACFSATHGRAWRWTDSSNRSRPTCAQASAPISTR